MKEKLAVCSLWFPISQALYIISMELRELGTSFHVECALDKTLDFIIPVHVLFHCSREIWDTPSLQETICQAALVYIETLNQITT